MPKAELFWSVRHSTHGLRWVLASRKLIYAIVTGKFTPKGEAYFIAEYHVANRMPNRDRAASLSETMALAEAHYADLGYVESNQWTERFEGVEGLKDTTPETDLAEFRSEM